MSNVLRIPNPTPSSRSCL
ncbi:excinuclease ABC, subunit A domain protein, partial [Chlamydia psittaci 84-8471/1]